MGELRLENRRGPWRLLKAADKKLLSKIEDLSDPEARKGLEVVDVVDAASGDKRFVFALWPFGSGMLVDVARERVVADVAQHHFDARGDASLHERLSAAWARDHAALGVREKVEFTAEAGGTRAAPETRTGAIRERIVALRKAIAHGETPAQPAIWALVREALDLDTQRPIPRRRLFELDETTREALALVHEGYDDDLPDLAHVGLPASVGRTRRRDPAQDPGALARFLGHAPPLPLDAPILFQGHEHPLSFLVSDAVHGVRPFAEVVDAIVALPADTVSAHWIALARQPPRTELTGSFAPPPPGAQRGSPAALGAHTERYVRFLTELGARLDEHGERAAREVLAARADWVERWLPQLERSPQMIVPHWLEQCAALALLARRTRLAGGELDAVHDARLHALARYHDATYPLVVALADLPPARAARVACASLELVARFPSPEGVDAAIGHLEAAGGGPWAKGVFEAVIAAVGPAARPALEAAIARKSAQARLLKACLSKLAKPGR